MSCQVVGLAAIINPGVDLLNALDQKVNGVTGNLLCSGTVRGDAVQALSTAVMTIKIDAPSVSCAGILAGYTTNGGSYDLTVPTTAGDKTMHGTFAVTATLGAAITFTGGIQATGTFQPTSGNCVTTPLTGAIAEFALAHFTN